MPYVKLDCGILNSTLWFERDAREVFITALLMAEPHELLEPMPQLEVMSLEPTGWVVPAGWYGFVPAAGVGIIHRARVEEQAGYAALEQLGSPEASSRSPEFDGRRLVRIDGGYLVLNFIKYREKDATTAERSRRWRERQKAKAKPTVTRDVDADTRDTTLKQKQKQKQKYSSESGVDANAQWLLDSYPVWYAEERNGARYILKPALDAPSAFTLVQTWPDRTHLERMCRLFLRADNIVSAHANRGLALFADKYASGCDAKIRAGAA